MCPFHHTLFSVGSDTVTAINRDVTLLIYTCIEINLSEHKRNIFRAASGRTFFRLETTNQFMRQLLLISCSEPALSMFLSLSVLQVLTTCVFVCGERGHMANVPEHTSPRLEFPSYNYLANQEQVASNRSVAFLRHLLLPIFRKLHQISQYVIIIIVIGITIIIIIIAQFFLRQVHSLSQSLYAAQCDVMLSLQLSCVYCCQLCVLLLVVLCVLLLVVLCVLLLGFICLRCNCFCLAVCIVVSCLVCIVVVVYIFVSCLVFIVASFNLSSV